ncbi:unnamed protein product, partial [Mesorhabditis spiculigera]
MIRVALAIVLLGAVLAQEEGPRIKMRFPSAATIAKGTKYANWRVGKDAKKITPVFNPQLIINMGTPPQEFLGCGLDISSGDTWIIDYQANQPNPAPWLYEPRNSSTYKKSSYPYAATVVDVDDNPATLTGTIGDEIFGFSQFRFPMRFGMVENVVPVNGQADIPDVFATGRCGFGFYPSDYIDAFLPKVMAAANASQKTFTTVIHDCMLNKDAEEVLTEMTIGFIDGSYCNLSTTVTVPLVDRNNWNWAITGYQIGNLTSTQRQIAKMDSNELRTGVPQNVYNYIYTATNATMDPSSPWPMVSCDQQFPPLNFNTTNDFFSVHSHYYVFKDFKDDQNPCYLMLYPMDGGGFLPSWSFGYVWMYKKMRDPRLR